MRRLWRALYVDRLNPDEFKNMAALAVLAEDCRKYAVRQTGED